jgi:SAM-dependent methyltransferase
VGFALSPHAIILILCLGVGVALVGIAIVMPALLRTCLAVKAGSDAAQDWRGRVQLRYQNLRTYHWMFVRFKLRRDPMFLELPDLVQAAANVRTILDVGCGYGVAGCAMLEWFPQAAIYAMDPDTARVGVAASAFGERGQVVQAGAPHIVVPGFPPHFDLILMLDVIHYISDAEFKLTLERICDRLDAGGRLVLRAVIPPSGLGSKLWNLEQIRQRIIGLRAYYRTVDQICQRMVETGLKVSCAKCSGGNPESYWFVAQAESSTGIGQGAMPSGQLAAQAQNQEHD